MLERVAVHQTRLRTPGLGLDARGVALGGKGVVLLPSIDSSRSLRCTHVKAR
jgi:hypothetical protein